MISIIIPSYHSQSTIAECIRSLLAQKVDDRFEILVINSSSDETSRMVKENFPAVRFFQLEERVFAGTARNRGIQEANGEILAFIDADCTAPPDWLSRMLRWHHKGYRAVSGSLVNESRDNIFSRAEYPLEIVAFSPNNPRKEVKFASAANCSFQREVFRKYGLFPEIRAGEDMVFCQKITEKGEKIIFDPEIEVFHKHSINFSGFINKQLMHGKYSFRARQLAKLSGSFINNPFLFPVLLPLLPFIRASGGILRSLILKNKLIYDIISTFPLFFLGCMMWSSGYAKGYFNYFFNKHEDRDYKPSSAAY
jgi:GT2 family glycosyltransferase